jgi:hypothetical protein
MGELDHGRFENFSGNSHVYGHEAPTELQVILGERRFFIPLPNYFKYYELGTVCSITSMSPHYKYSFYKHIQKGEIGYDKLKQVRWLVDAIQNTCRKEWLLGKFVTIDEMMVRYKGSYCPI